MWSRPSRNSDENVTDQKKEKKVLTTLFKPEPVFKIEISDVVPANALAPKFKVTIKHSTLVKDFDEAQKKYSTNDAVAFKIVDFDHLQISITPSKFSFDRNDKDFRSALAIPTRYHMTSKESEQIINQYEKYLSDNNLVSKFSPKSSREMSFRPGADHSY